MPDTQLVTMPIRCAFCGARLAIMVADWTPDIYAERSTHDVLCPGCQQHQSVTLSGHIVQVTKHAD